MSQPDTPWTKVALALAALGELLISVFLGGGLGYLVERLVPASAPWAVLIGSLAGLALGVSRIIKEVK